MSLNAVFYVILFMRLKLQNVRNVKKKKKITHTVPYHKGGGGDT